MDASSGQPVFDEKSSLVNHPSSDERTMGILAHILALIAPIIAPLIIYLVKKDESKYVAAQAKESLNFQITVALVAIVLAISIVGLLVIWIVPIWSFILVIIATVKASENKIFRYPLTLRLIK